MKKHVGALCTIALLAGSRPNLFAQGSQPSQPVDPTAQAPATPAPATPPTFPTSEARPRPDRPDVRVYMGTIVKDGDAYVLKAGNEKYLLDSRKKAKNYKGKDVKITLTFSCPFLEDDLQRCTLASQIGSQISISQSMNFIFWPHFSGMHEGAPPDRPQKPSANVAS